VPTPIKTRQEGEWIVFESEDGLQARIREDTKYELERIWGKVRDHIEVAFEQMRKMRQQAQEDAKKEAEVKTKSSHS
jgi:hypothetical protein